VVKVNQEELAAAIKKLKEKAKAARDKAAGKTSDPAARKAKKNVKRAQRKLRQEGKEGRGPRISVKRGAEVPS
jgi:hypothetical protein